MSTILFSARYVHMGATLFLEMDLIIFQLIILGVMEYGIQ